MTELKQMIVPFSGQTEVDVLLLYPGDSLREQVVQCLGKKAGLKVGTCFATPLPEIRKALAGVRSAVLELQVPSAQGAPGSMGIARAIVWIRSVGRRSDPLRAPQVLGSTCL